MSIEKLPVHFILTAVIAALCLSFTATAFAGKPAGGGGGKGGKPTTNGTIALVLVDSTDGVAHWNQHVRFDVQTTVTTEPRVDLACYQGGTMVYFKHTGYWDGYAWPWTQTMNLASGAWTGGDADCTATLYKLDNNGRRANLATLNFHVFA
jgi:hypothetical protein